MQNETNRSEVGGNPLSSWGLELPEVQPWPEPVDGKLLLDELVRVLKRFLILPKWGAETLALWTLHTYAFQLRNVSTYVGIESPEKQCGKTTLLTVLSELVHRPEVAANISSPAFFRVIEETQPTLLIDEADTFLQGNDQLRGILNSGYSRKTAYVVRVASQEAEAQKSETKASRLVRFSCWCPKAIAAIGRLPETLADRCIVIRMQRKTPHEQCERLRNLDGLALRRQCARFVLDHAANVAEAQPEIPSSLPDRAADIWEPLLALADLAGGAWPELARQAAVGLASSAQESNPIGSLLLDIFVLFATLKVDRMFTRTLVMNLNALGDRPWAEMRNGKEITDQWLAQQLRPYPIRTRTMRIGEMRAKGYFLEEFAELFHRYIPRAEAQAFRDELKAGDEPSPRQVGNETQGADS